MQCICFKRWGMFLIATVFLTLGVSVITAQTVLADDSRFVMGTTINGQSVSNMTVADAKARVQSVFDNYKITVIDANDKTEIISGSEIGYQAKVTDEAISSLLEAQNAAGRLSGPTSGDSNKLYVPIEAEYDEAALKARIESMPFMTASDIVPTKNAALAYDSESDKYYIVPEIQGNDIDADAFLQAVKDCIAGGQTSVNLTDRGCYKTVTVRSEDESITALLDSINSCKEMSITLTIGSESETIEPSTIWSWIRGENDEGQIGVDYASVNEYIQTLANRYSTEGKARNFKTWDGRDVQVSGALGWSMNVPAETDNLINMIRTGQTGQTHDVGKPVNDWGDTFVEVDMANQHAFYFQAGACVWEAPCVTGNPSKGNATPDGIYTLYSKEEDRILKGEPDASGKPSYESHVNYWMPFNGGIGLHDASWRSSFGGTIYSYAGSHGCVNLPSDKAAQLYGMLNVGTPVICHN